ncbi:hypothetical protein IE4872_PD01727 (plasmid) [Rhizobium gallicum]|uniref:Uncharacterized protein n=1 Tax=Rhizobium gallicum TaxID=56730 RepID=A0A1L5NWJ3_9HYPH|nr:hypothetical protein IE4872_PD01727 [Rhizobium gallicum]
MTSSSAQPMPLVRSGLSSDCLDLLCTTRVADDRKPVAMKCPHNFRQVFSPIHPSVFLGDTPERSQVRYRGSDRSSNNRGNFLIAPARKMMHPFTFKLAMRWPH